MSYFKCFVTLIPTQRPTLTQAGELGGKERGEKQTQTRTGEEIPQGLPGIEREVRQYLQCNPLKICTRCRALRRASLLWLSTLSSIPGQCVRCWTKLMLKRENQGGEGGGGRLGTAQGRYLLAKLETTACLIKRPYCGGYFIIFAAILISV